jgi:hypothetical protein
MIAAHVFMTTNIPNASEEMVLLLDMPRMALSAYQHPSLVYSELA